MRRAREPFGALDAKTRKEQRHCLRSLHERLGLTTVFVTHDQDEALERADLVAVMNQGKIEQIATPAELRANPVSDFVADFLGQAIAPGVVPIRTASPRPVVQSRSGEENF